METAVSTRRALLVLLVMTVSLFSPDRADAMYSEWREIERPIDWRLSLGQHEFGIAEEIHVRKWFWSGEFEDGREVQSVGTAIHFGFGAVTVPCRLVVFVTAVVGSIVGVVVLAMLPSLRRRWVMKQ